MRIPEVLAALDHEIALLKQARTLLAGSNSGHRNGSRASAAHAAGHPAKATRSKKRRLSPEGRRRIAEAARKRWAAQRKAAAK
jgi:hypothetical protein